MAKVKRRPYINKSAPMEERMAYACIQVWQTMGGDVMACLGKEEVEREVCFDVVCDYIDQALDTDAVKAFKALTPDERDLLLARTFPYEYYT